MRTTRDGFWLERGIAFVWTKWRLLLVVALGLPILGWAQGKPNIVLFIADDHTCSDCGAYGSREVRTPNLDRLAGEGLLFRNAFAASPTCMPSRAVLFTGLMPFRNGAHANNLAGYSQCKEGIRSLPQYLSELGYRTAQAGKTHFGPRSVFPFERIEGSEVPERGYEKNPALRMDLSVEAVEGWLAKQTKEKPFCLVVCDHSPHVIWTEPAVYDAGEVTVPPNHIDTLQTRKSRARYYTDITKMDGNVGAVLAALSKHGLLRETVFIYTSDQGAQWPFAKWSLYDAGIRVPLIVRWPGVTAGGGVSESMISLADITPTLIEIAGGKAPVELDGKSFLRVIRQPTTVHREIIFATHSQDGSMNVTPMRCARDRRYKYILNLAPKNEYTTHMDRAKDHDGGREYWDSWERRGKEDPLAAAILRRYHWRPQEELYDTALDPYEVHNLIDDPRYGTIGRELKARLTEWREQQGDHETGPRTVPAEK